MAKAKKKELTAEERLAAALVPESEQPYKVPENWVIVYFTSLIDIQGGTQPPKSTFVDELKEGYVRLVQIRDFSSDKYACYIPKTNKLRYFNEEDILIARYGASLGRICTGLSGACNVALAKTMFSEAVLYRPYVYWMLQSECFQTPLMKLSRTAQVGFNKEDLSYFTIPLPPLPEQRRIVERIENLFENLDRAKELAQNALDSFETRKAAILHKAFTGELTAKWREEHGVGLESWEEKPLSDLCDSFQYGTSKKSEQSGEVVVLRMGNLQNGELDCNDLAYSTDKEDIKKYFLSTGDVLFNRTNSPELVGKTSVYRGQMSAIFAGYLIRINYNREFLDGYYLNYVMNSQRAKQYCNAVKSDGVNQSNINAKKLSSFTIPHCKIEEQKEIVRILDDLFEKESRACELCDVIEKIDLMKKAILARAFRGELGTNDPKEESAKSLLLN